jgi:hypothetical protein
VADKPNEHGDGEKKMNPMIHIVHATQDTGSRGGTEGERAYLSVTPERQGSGPASGWR